MSEEQGEEIEALQAIYVDEFEFVEGCDESTPPLKFKIKLIPNPDGGDNFVALDLICAMPEGYPEECGPEVTIEIKKGIGEKQKPEIEELIQAQATENIGMASMYVIAEAVREWLVDNNVQGQDGSMYAEMMRRMQQKDVEKKKIDDKKAIALLADSEKNATVGPDREEEERIRKRQAGTAMSVEAFEAWKIAFDKEMSEKAAAAAKLDKSIVVMTEEEKAEYYAKPTGKQLFLTNKAKMEEALGSIGDSGEEIAKAMTEATRQAKLDAGLLSPDDVDLDISEDLFLGDEEDYEDLDDLLDDDDDDENEEEEGDK